MKLISRPTSTLPLTPVPCWSRSRYSNLSTSIEFRLFATMSHRNLVPGVALSTLALVIKSHTLSMIPFSRSMPLSSTIHRNMSAPIASWFHGGSSPACHPATRLGRNSLSNTCENGPWPKSWHRPAN